MLTTIRLVQKSMMQRDTDSNTFGTEASDAESSSF